MKKKNLKKLTLPRETLRSLAAPYLQHAGAGYQTRWYSCSVDACPSDYSYCISYCDSCSPDYC
jgi:hypothetical protein